MSPFFTIDYFIKTGHALIIIRKGLNKKAVKISMWKGPYPFGGDEVYEQMSLVKLPLDTSHFEK